MCLKKPIPFLACLVVAWTVQGAVPNEHFEDALWVAESHGVMKLLAADGTLQVEIDSADEVRSVAVDAVAGRVWVSRPERLAAYGFDGEVALDVPLEATRPAADKHLLSVDRRDGTVWLARGQELQIFAFDSTPVASFATGKAIQAISLAEQAGQRWVATKHQATLRDEQGAVLVSLDVPRGEKLHDLAYDATQASVWLLTNKKLHFLDLEQDHVEWALDLRNAECIRLLKGDGAWVAGNSHVAKISTDGELVRSFEYSQLGDLVAFVVDTMDNSLWLATQQHLGHYRPDGTVIEQTAFTDPEQTGRLWSLDMYIDDIPPSVHFALPESGTLTNDNQLPFVLEYGDIGIGTDPTTIGFIVNDTEASFSCTKQGEGSAQCTPSYALPEGQSRVSATVSDFSGNVSEPAQVDVKVDTIPPVITVTTPEDGAEVTDSPVIVAGHIDGNATLRVNGQNVSLNNNLGFSTEVPLESGSNTIQLEATDLAGNTAHGELAIVLRAATIPPDPAKVASPIDPSKPTTIYDSTRFLYDGPEPIQRGVELEVIEPKRVAVLRGKVLDQSGQPLSGVTVRVHDHPEYGNTLTREDGIFDLVVNGGGTTTIEYEKSGYMPVQRAIETPWRDYRWLPNVVMTQYDDQVTQIDLSSDEAIQTARGSTVTDADGERTATVMFPAGVSAEMVMPSGSRQVIETLDVRATEYTVGPNGRAAMPGELPPTSAYTYAIELSVDQALEAGAKSVEFSDPVPLYLDNFLDFPVGIDVPIGYYDREKGEWIPSQDGRIIEVLDEVDGLAILDVTGDGALATATELSALNITDAERKKLASLYAIGKTLWRAPIPHFSPWDLNWPYTFPEDAVPPAEDIDSPDEQEDDPCLQQGSVIECQNQVLGKRVSVEGTPFTLNYRSNRVPGRRESYRLEVPITGSEISGSLKRVEVSIDIAGRRIDRVFPPVPDQKWNFEWDGRDAYGREPFGAQLATITVRNVYDPVFVDSNEQLQSSFGEFGNVDRILSDRTRGEVVMEQVHTVPVGVWDSRTVGLGGWTLNVHHAYDRLTQHLFHGSGSTARSENLNEKVVRYAGDGNAFYDPLNENDGILAREASFDVASGIGLAPNGDIYVTAAYNLTSAQKVYRVDVVTKKIYEFAGNGQDCAYNESPCEEEGLATEVAVHMPRDVAVGPSGNVFIGTDYGISMVRPDGFLERIAHDPRTSYQGKINSISVSSNGTVYYAFGHSVKRLNSDGSVTVIAGQPGESGFRGDGGPASEALFDEIDDIDIGFDGRIYVADSKNSVIRRIGQNGRVETIAGTPGMKGRSGDGGPATEAVLYYPEAVEVARDGSVYIGDTANSDIRRIAPDGTIETVAGVVSRGWIYCVPGYEEEEDIKHCRDNNYANNMAFNTIVNLELNPDDELFVSDKWRRHIYKIEAPLPEFELGETVVPSREGRNVFVFDEGGKHRKTIDLESGAVLYKFEYGSSGYLEEVVDRFGNATRIARDDDGEAIAIIGPFGQETQFELDDNGYLIGIKSPIGQTRKFQYARGLLERSEDPNGNLSIYEFDSDGRLTESNDAIGGGWGLVRTESETGYSVTTQSAQGWSFDHEVKRPESGERKQIATAPSGGSSTGEERPDGSAEYMGSDGVSTVVREAPHPLFGPTVPFTAEATVSLPGGQQMAVERSLEFSGDRKTPFGEHDIDEILTVNGRSYGSHYDAATRTWTRTSPEGRTSTVQLNEQRQVVSSRLGSLAPVGRIFNSRGQVSQVNQSTRTTSLSYDGNGYLKQVVDAESRVTAMENDRVGRTKELHLPGERLVKFDFDANGNVTGITPPERATHGFAYNGVDLATRYEPPPVDGTDSTVETDYRLDRTVGAVTRADGGDVDLTYGKSTGLLTGIAAPQGAYSYTYLPNSDRLASATGPAGQRLDYAWNGPLVDQVTWSGQIDGQVNYAWDDNFWLDALTVNGQTIDYRYDNDGLVTGAGQLTLDYAPTVPLLESTDLGSVQTGWTYNEYGEPISYQVGLEGGPALYRTKFTRDRLGRITEKVETVGGVETTSAYEYDAAGRLIEVQENGTVVDTYSYDANGNRLSHDSTTGVYDAQDRLLSYGDYDYSYRPDGELESMTNTDSGETTRYTYDAFSNLRQVTLPDGTEIEYVIDAQNRRIGKKVDGKLTRGFLYADQLNPVAELNGDGNIESVFVYASRLNVPDFIIKGRKTYRVIADHLGSVRFVVDTQTGELVQRMDYSAFGRVISDTNPGFQPFGYAGGLYDRQTKFLRFGVRDYNPLIGRWNGKEMAGFIASTNLYSYVANDPVNYFDDSGLEKKRTINRPGPAVDQSGRAGGRAGNPISGPYKPKPTTADKVGKGIAKQAAKQLLRKLGIPPSLIGSPLIAFPALLGTPNELGCGSFDCDNNGIPDEWDAVNMCPVL